jgi:hypothetical protein
MLMPKVAAQGVLVQKMARQDHPPLVAVVVVNPADLVAAVAPEVEMVEVPYRLMVMVMHKAAAVLAVEGELVMELTLLPTVLDQVVLESL